MCSINNGQFLFPSLYLLIIMIGQDDYFLSLILPFIFVMPIYHILRIILICLSREDGIHRSVGKCIYHTPTTRVLYNAITCMKNAMYTETWLANCTIHFQKIHLWSNVRKFCWKFTWKSWIVGKLWNKYSLINLKKKWPLRRWISPPPMDSPLAKWFVCFLLLL